MRGGPRGIAKDVVKSQTAVYHFTAADLRKRLKLPDTAKFTVGGEGGVFILDDTTTLDVEVKS